MTIYKLTVDDTKGADKFAAPEIVTEDVPLAEKSTHEDVVVATPIGLVLLMRRNRRSLFNLCLILVALLFICVTAFGGLCLYRQLLVQKAFIGRCGVRYFEYGDSSSDYLDRIRLYHQHFKNAQRARFLQGQFDEGVEIDEQYGLYEKLEVPQVGDSRRATVVHDFEKNMTAIVDRDRLRCFLMPLNRTLVKPPRNFIDMLVKFRSGYYLPNAEIVRDNYRVSTPAIQDFESFGRYIESECQYFDTYQLVRVGEPYAMSKRAVCDVAGEKYCLGDAGADQMLCINLLGCV